jgi:hypothetical protein
MINFFKSLNPLNIIWLALLLFILRVAYLFHLPLKIDSTFSVPFGKLLLTQSLYLNFSPVANVCIAALLVFGQALLLNRFVNHFNFLGKPTFLPALMYITVSGLFTPFLVLSAPLLCNFLVLWMLFKLLGFYKSKDSKAPAFDLGMIVGVGSLIYLPFIYFFLLIWVSLMLFKPFNWREWVTCIIGYCAVFLFLAVYYYLNNSLSLFGLIWMPLATHFPASLNINYLNYIILVPVLLILLLCFFKLRKNFYKSYVHVRKSFQLLLLTFLLAASTFYTKAGFQLNHFLLCAVPAAVFFAYYFLHASGKWFYESLYILLLIMIVYFQFNTF